MEVITKMMDDIQAKMAERFDKEFNEIRFFVDSAYEHGLADGKAQGYVRGLKEGEESAKASIVAMIKGEIK
jgi:flagellar biosynthesis/type III secretory pathway protein FliH